MKLRRNGAFIFGRKKVTIVLKTISIKATQLQKGNEAEGRPNNRLKGVFSPFAAASWYLTRLSDNTLQIPAKLSFFVHGHLFSL